MRNRRASICLHAAVCHEFKKVHWSAAPGGNGGILEFMSPASALAGISR